ncbi:MULTISPECIES: IucA/IucC family protein [unclassified Psychrobacter]|uniref:IucA/IucC family protein n=1 Tax=unclassified Psychrobacter TaxID=196806 RepID=UPI00086A87CE|nr:MULTISPECIES: IucA/IucC family protein [unclassified Psychrobacter]OEH66911.1 MAG: short-chain oxidoreductase [Psychrobacter sp. B29-1]PKG65125.1 short-chain oxidoreductase [Psychrobacter sp. Choline-02u-13]PKH55111.1 short-chain oxidoreductase [Psychrobacter sp. Choline-02u-9]TEW88113.1 short-chain oxidoreductase [Psychrobacter sp. 230]|tara:strand:+ start:928 stop:2850 length:1923 start_codon:yes stop_codon:yes gene_type:complete
MSNNLANSTKNNNSHHSTDVTYATKPWQASVNSQIMARAEQRVIKQLLQALLYENIIDFESESANNAHESTGNKSLLNFVIQASDDVRYTAQGYIHYSFDIIRLNDLNVQRVVNGVAEDAILEHVISDILLNIEGAELKDSFIKELRHTLVNETQSQILASNIPVPIDTLTYEQLEGYLTAGHPYHPCFKSRIGFDLQDNYDYGPEFDQNIDVVWLAVKKELLVSNTTTGIDINEWVKDYVGADEFDALNAKLIEVLTIANETANDYCLIPAHPWQWQNTLVQALQPLLATQEVIYLGDAGHQYRAQQSIRSLTMLGNSDENGNNDTINEKAYLKLSMHLINTSSTRILAKHTVMNAAVVTTWLNQLIVDDKTAQALPIAFLGETVGVSLNHEALRARGYQHPNMYGGLAAIWRENVSQHLSTGQTAFPLNGVSYINADDSHLIDPWLDKYGVETWIAQLIKVTVTPLLHILFGYGVALECHAQNIVLVHENGYPIKVLLKDLHDGVRYSPEHLTQQHLRPDFYSLPPAHAALNRGSFIETEDTDGIRDMTVACLFFVALSDIAIFMQTHYHYSEVAFWQQVADCVTDYQTSHPEHQVRFDLFDIFAEQTRIESLAKRRLFGDKAFPIKYINNPLFKSRG